MFEYKFGRYGKKKRQLAGKKKRDKEAKAEKQKQKQEYWFFYIHKTSNKARAWLVNLSPHQLALRKKITASGIFLIKHKKT